MLRDLSPATLFRALRTGLVTLFLIIGFFGWREWLGSTACPQEGVGFLFSDALYRSVQLFFLGFEPPPCVASVEMPTSLQTARWGAFFSAVIVALSIIVDPFKLLIRRLWAVLTRRETFVVIGFGQTGSAICSALYSCEDLASDDFCRVEGSERKGRVVVLEPEVTPSRRRVAGEVNAELVGLNVHGVGPFHRFAIGFSSALRIFVAAGDDATNLDIAEFMISSWRIDPELVWIHIDDYKLLTRLRDIEISEYDKHPPGQFFSFLETVAENLVTELCDPIDARDLGQERYQVCLIGRDTLSLAVLESIAHYGHMPAPGCERPRVILLAKDATEFLAGLRSAHAPLMHRVEFVAVDYDLATINWRDQPLPIGSDEIEKTTAFVFAAIDDSESLAGALTFHRGMSLGRQERRSTFVTTWVTNDELSLKPSEADGYKLTLLGNFIKAAPASSALNPNIETLARLFHDAYLDEVLGLTEADQPSFDSLSATMRRSNYRAALHCLIKLKAFGLSGVSATKPALGLQPSDQEKIDAILSTPQSRAAFAEFEHVRWCSDRRMEGWLPGDKKNGKTRTHPMLKYDREGYQDLPESEKGKDLVQLEMLKSMINKCYL